MESRQSSGLSQKLALYGLGVGAVSLACPADADIVYSGPLTFTGNTIYFDLENVVPPSAAPDAVNDDFGLNLRKAKASIYDNGSNTTTVGTVDSSVRGTNNYNYAIRRSSGDTIGSGGNFVNAPFFQNAYTGGIDKPGQSQGDWNPGTRGFVGLQLVVGANTFFGWADVTLNNLDGSGAGGLTLNGYAYDNLPNTPIPAGAIPEPSTIALLITGAAGVLALKRRRK